MVRVGFVLFLNSGLKSSRCLKLYPVRKVLFKAWAAQQGVGLMFMLLVVVLSGVSLVLESPVSRRVVLVARAEGRPLCMLPRMVLKVVRNVVVLVSSLVLSLIVQV